MDAIHLSGLIWSDTDYAADMYRKHFEREFSVVVDDIRYVIPDFDVDEYRDDIVEACSKSGTEFEALLAFYDLGYVPRASEYRAIEDMFRFVDVDRKNLFKKRARQEGTKSPVTLPLVVKRRGQDVSYLAFQPAVLVDGMECAFVCVDGNEIERDSDGLPDVFTGCWSGIELIRGAPRNPAIVEDLEQVLKAKRSATRRDEFDNYLESFFGREKQFEFDFTVADEI